MTTHRRQRVINISPWGFPATIDPMLPRTTDNVAITTANLGTYWRIRDGGLITKVAIVVGTQSGNICVAAYRNSGSGRDAVPGTRLATSGAVACPATGYAEVSLDGAVELYPGDWLALSADNNTATFRCLISGSAALDLAKGRCMQQSAAHPLPATPSSLAALAGRNIALVGVNS